MRDQSQLVLIEKSSSNSKQFSAQIGVFFKRLSSMKPKIIIRKNCWANR